MPAKARPRWSAKGRIVHKAKLVYPGDPKWGHISKERTSFKLMKDIQARLPKHLSQQIDSTVSTICKWRNQELNHTVKYLSDEQFDLTVSRMQGLSPSELEFGLKILMGGHPDPVPFGRYPQLPEVVRKQKKQLSSGPDETSEEWAVLQQHVHALPPELFNEVKKLTLDAAFLADIYPHQRAGIIVNNSKPCISDDINFRALGLLDRSTHEQYSQRVWVENLWVTDTRNIVRWSEMLWWNSDKIRRVHLSFRREDCIHIQWVVQSAWLRAMRIETLDSWRSFMDHDSWSDAYATSLVPALLDVWSDSFTDTFGCKLGELILNFEDAQGIDGTFLGIRLAERLPPFDLGVVPDILTIEAPTVALADSIRQILMDTNAEERSWL